VAGLISRAAEKLRGPGSQISEYPRGARMASRRRDAFGLPCHGAMCGWSGRPFARAATLRLPGPVARHLVGGKAATPPMTVPAMMAALSLLMTVCRGATPSGVASIG